MSAERVCFRKGDHHGNPGFVADGKSELLLGSNGDLCHRSMIVEVASYRDYTTLWVGKEIGNIAVHKGEIRDLHFEPWFRQTMEEVAVFDETEESGGLIKIENGMACEVSFIGVDNNTDFYDVVYVRDGKTNGIWMQLMYR